MQRNLFAQTQYVLTTLQRIMESLKQLFKTRSITSTLIIRLDIILSVFTESEEQRIDEWCVYMARIGYGRTRQKLPYTVKTILDEDKRPNPFHDNKPGRAWLGGCFKRNPQLTVRTTIELGKERPIINAGRIKMWFSNFKTYIENEVKDPDLLSDPTCIYNADETGVSLCLMGSQVIGIKGAPVVYQFGNSDKTQITVMAACSAAANYIPPMLVFPGQRFTYNSLGGGCSKKLSLVVRTTVGWTLRCFAAGLRLHLSQLSMNTKSRHWCYFLSTVKKRMSQWKPLINACLTE